MEGEQATSSEIENFQYYSYIIFTNENDSHFEMPSLSVYGNAFQDPYAMEAEWTTLLVQNKTRMDSLILHKYKERSSTVSFCHQVESLDPRYILQLLFGEISQDC
jgi:hypothetical protein